MSSPSPTRLHLFTDSGDGGPAVPGQDCRGQMRTTACSRSDRLAAEAVHSFQQCRTERTIGLSHIQPRSSPYRRPPQCRPPCVPAPSSVSMFAAIILQLCCVLAGRMHYESNIPKGQRIAGLPVPAVKSSSSAEGNPAHGRRRGTDRGTPCAPPRSPSGTAPASATSPAPRRETESWNRAPRFRNRPTGRRISSRLPARATPDRDRCRRGCDRSLGCRRPRPRRRGGVHATARREPSCGAAKGAAGLASSVCSIMLASDPAHR